MNKLKLAFAAMAALIGVGASYATKVKPDAGFVEHYWNTVGGTTVFFGTTAQAELNCPGDGVTCLQAVDKPLLLVYKSGK